MKEKQKITIEKFEKFALQGLNCKQIAKKFGYHQNSFGYIMKDILGVYPSVYIARMKK